MSALEAATLATPAGPLGLVVDDGVLVAAGFTAELEELRVRLAPERRARPLRVRRELGAVSAALDAYFAGSIEAIDAVPVDQPGTEHQQRVWRALRAVPPGRTLTYTELAERAASSHAVRAVGTACGRNLIGLVVPCHRIVRRDGGLGGYYYGLEVKRRLLEHERRHTGPGQLDLAV